jgi:flagellar biosynthesis chaperone FliJ
MAGFTFRLEALLTEKVEADRKARTVVGEKQRCLEAEESELRRRIEKESEIKKNLSRKRFERLSAAENQMTELQRRNAHLNGLQQDIDSAHKEVAEQLLVVEDAERALRVAREYAKRCTREAETLAKYREKQEKRFLAALEKKEELELDELGTVMYLSQRTNA